MSIRDLPNELLDKILMLLPLPIIEEMVPPDNPLWSDRSFGRKYLSSYWQKFESDVNSKTITLDKSGKAIILEEDQRYFKDDEIMVSTIFYGIPNIKFSRVNEDDFDYTDLVIDTYNMTFLQLRSSIARYAYELWTTDDPDEFSFYLGIKFLKLDKDLSPVFQINIDV